MLEILPALTFAPYAALMAKAGLDDSHAVVLEALQRGQVLGACLFAVDGETAVIHSVDCGDDDSLYDGLVRAALNMALSRGAVRASFALADRSVCRRLGFVRDDSGAAIDDIASFLTKCKKCANP